MKFSLNSYSEFLKQVILLDIYETILTGSFLDLFVKSQLQENAALSSQKQKNAVQNFFMQKQNVNKKNHGTE